MTQGDGLLESSRQTEGDPFSVQVKIRFGKRAARSKCQVTDALETSFGALALESRIVYQNTTRRAVVAAYEAKGLDHKGRTEAANYSRGSHAQVRGTQCRSVQHE